MDEVLDLLQSLIQQAGSLSDELTPEEMAYVLEIFKNAVEALQTQPAPIAPTGPVPPAEFPSSNINGLKYDPQSGELLVQFHGPYPQAEGPVYSYGGVPEYLFNIISKGAIGPKTSGENRYHKWIKGVTPSLGGTVNAILKAGKFPYQKVS